jgi:hypothetical protein
LWIAKDTIDYIFSIPPKPINLYHRIQEIADITPKQVSDLFVKSWIDGISVKKRWSDMMDQISVFNDNKIKTESQLRKIREEANQ